MSSVLQSFDHFIFDVDRTIAPNNEQIPALIIQKLRQLIEFTNIAIVTSRSIHEGFELLAQPFFQTKSQYHLMFFPCSAGKAYTYDYMTGRLLKLYDKAKSDIDFQQYHQNFLRHLKNNAINLVEDVKYDAAERNVQIYDRSAQVTLFFSNSELRNEYEIALHSFNVSFIRHGNNTLHVVPKNIDKHLAIHYLMKENSRFLVFADGFYDFPEMNRQGNDLAFTAFPENEVTCINVGRDIPKINSGVFYLPNSDLIECELTNYLLEKILQSCSFKELELTQMQLKK